MPIVFVTGTDTGCGKTHVSCALLQALRQAGHTAVGYKPVASGCERTPQGLRNDDALALMAHSSAGFGYADINPIALQPAIAPHVAAADARVEVDLDRLIDGAKALQQRADWVVVEGAGGFLVPLNDRDSFADMAQRAGWPVLLVVAMRLGCINHALLSVEAIAQRTRLRAWVANVMPPEQTRLQDNVDSLDQRIAVPRMGLLRHAQPAQAAGELNLDCLGVNKS